MTSAGSYNIYVGFFAVRNGLAMLLFLTPNVLILINPLNPLIRWIHRPLSGANASGSF